MATPLQQQPRVLSLLALLELVASSTTQGARAQNNLDWCMDGQVSDHQQPVMTIACKDICT